MDWLLQHGTRIGVLILLAALASWAARHTIPRAVKLTLARQRVEDGEEPEAQIALEEQAQRARTLAAVLVRTIDVTAFGLAAIVALGEAGFQLGPLIAGAGVVGLAIGFGAQSLVRDVLAGMFILFENQFDEGDVVNIAGIGGTVQRINLRRTILRDIDGIVHTIPNGQIQVASNLTRSFARVNLNVEVGYGEDLDRVRAVIDAVGAELAADPDWSEKILEAPGRAAREQARRLGHRAEGARHDAADDAVGGDGRAAPADQAAVRPGGDRDPVPAPGADRPRRARRRPGRRGRPRYVPTD